MRVVVSGNFKKPILLDSKEATAVMIATEDGQPTVLFKLLPDGQGWIRYVKGEDKNFDNEARQLRIT